MKILKLKPMSTYEILNTVLTSAAFIAVIVSLIISQKQINETRRDAHRDRFENTFFGLMENHSRVISNLNWFVEDEKDRSIKVRATGQQYISSMLQGYTEAPFYGEFHLSKVYYSYSGLSNLSNFYKSVKNVLNYVDKSEDLDDEEKFFFGSVFISSLSVEEKQALFYEITLENHQNIYIDDLRRIEKKYKFLKDIEKDVFHFPHMDFMYYAGIYDDFGNNLELKEKVASYKLNLKEEEAKINNQPH